MSAAATASGIGELRTVRVAELHESPWNPRKYYSKRGMEEITSSIKTNGILDPLQARPRKKGGYELAVGHRRLRAARNLKLETVPVIVREMTDLQLLKVLNIENLQREDVHPLEEGAGYRALMDKGGFDVPGIAAQVSKSVSYVYQRLKLADLVEPAQKALFDHRITASQAILIARLQPADQKHILKRCDRDMSVRNLRDWIHRDFHFELDRAAFDLDSATLLPAAGACVGCPKRATPELYRDMKKPSCTDRTCYRAKMDAFVKLQTQALRAAGKEPVRISSFEHFYGSDELPKDVLQRDSYILLEKKEPPCPQARTAIVVDGHDTGKVVAICAAPAKCKQHKQSRGGSSSRYNRNDAEREKRQREQRELNLATRRRILEAILASAGPLNKLDLELVVTEFFSTLSFDTKTSFFKLKFPDLPAKERNGWDRQTVIFRDWIALFDESALDLMLVELALFPYLADDPKNDYYKPADDQLLIAAERYQVDVAALSAAQTSAKPPAEPPADGRRACRKCGCTEDQACLDEATGNPCHWVAQDLCSACAAP